MEADELTVCSYFANRVKITRQDPTRIAPTPMSEITNKLYYGDNLTIMKEKMGSGFVNLIYLDPPFNSKKDYNLLYKKLTGKPVPEQAEAFCDTWEMDAEKEEIAKRMPRLMKEHGVEDYYARFWMTWIQALRHTQPHLLAYLIYMVQRLLYMKTVLRNDGSIYLHCDPTASHYIKVMMDGIFGHKNFRSEIIWKRTSSHNSAKRYGPVHDTILFYSMSDVYTWNPSYQPYDPEYLNTFFDQTDELGRRWKRTDLTGAGIRHGETGQTWRGINVTAKGRHWAQPPSVLDDLDSKGRIHWPQKAGGMPRLKQYPEDLPGIPLQDVWTDIRPIHNMSDDRLGYPTQKPITLLNRIIQASSNKGDIVFDPFCGCGTTVYAAAANERQWIGCDIAILSIRLIEAVLTNKYRLTKGLHFDISGIPASVDQAEELFSRDRFQFQNWFVERIGGFPMKKKVADRGIDGRIYFETRDGLKEVVLSVKGGGINPTDIRDLRGVLEREEDAKIAGFLSLKEPTRQMREEAAAAGRYEYNGVEYERIQLLTVREMFEEKKELKTPSKVRKRYDTGQETFPL